MIHAINGTLSYQYSQHTVLESGMADNAAWSVVLSGGGPGGCVRCAFADGTEIYVRQVTGEASAPVQLHPLDCGTSNLIVKSRQLRNKVIAYHAGKVDGPSYLQMSILFFVLVFFKRFF